MSNREILFRGKRKLDREWIFGNLLWTDDDGICIIQNHVPHHLLKDREVDPETICQYTTSNAKEGKKIFEHDIVEYSGAIGIVKFGKYGNGFHLGYYIDWINCPHFRNELCFWEGKVRVIGNILDNSNLIED